MKREIVHTSIDLCDSCVHGTKISGYGREIKLCGVVDRGQIQFPVERCTAYEAKGTMSRYEMENMAIYIEKKKDQPGFRFTKHVDGRLVDFK